MLLIVTLNGIVFGETTGEGYENKDHHREAEARDMVNLKTTFILIQAHNLSYLSLPQEYVNVYDCGSVAVALSKSLIQILTPF